MELKDKAAWWFACVREVREFVHFISRLNPTTFWQPGTNPLVQNASQCGIVRWSFRTEFFLVLQSPSSSFYLAIEFKFVLSAECPLTFPTPYMIWDFYWVACGMMWGADWRKLVNYPLEEQRLARHLTKECCYTNLSKQLPLSSWTLLLKRRLPWGSGKEEVCGHAQTDLQTNRQFKITFNFRTKIRIRIKNSGNPFPWGCSTHSTLMECHGGNFNARLAYTMNYGGPPVCKSVFYSFQSSLVTVRRPRRKAWLASAENIRIRDLKSGASNSLFLLRLNYHSPEAEAAVMWRWKEYVETKQTTDMNLQYFDSNLSLSSKNQSSNTWRSYS